MIIYKNIRDRDYIYRYMCYIDKWIDSIPFYFFDYFWANEFGTVQIFNLCEITFLTNALPIPPFPSSKG